jgi:hypothetical protein
LGERQRFLEDCLGDKGKVLSDIERIEYELLPKERQVRYRQLRGVCVVRYRA